MTAHRQSGYTGPSLPAGVVALLLFGFPAPASSHRIEKHFNVEPRPTVTVRNKVGKISIKSWARPEVMVVATHVSEKTEVDAEQVGNRVDMTTHLLLENVSPAELGADYEIMVPEETELQIRNDSGDVVVERVSGDMRFETVAADVGLQEVDGSLMVKTVGGSLLCMRCRGKIEVNSVSGSFRLIQPLSDFVHARTYSGDILFDGEFRPGGTYVLTSLTGLTEVRFGESDSFELKASSVSGKVENEATLQPLTHLQRPASAPPRYSSSLFGKLNKGQAKVELTSFSGTIRIRKRP